MIDSSDVAEQLGIGTETVDAVLRAVEALGPYIHAGKVAETASLEEHEAFMVLCFLAMTQRVVAFRHMPMHKACGKAVLPRPLAGETDALEFILGTVPMRCPACSAEVTSTTDLWIYVMFAKREAAPDGPINCPYSRRADVECVPVREVRSTHG